MELPACSWIILCPGWSSLLCAVSGFPNVDFCLDFCSSAALSVLLLVVTVLRAVFFVTVSVLALVVVIPGLTRFLLSILVSPAVVVSDASFNDNFDTAGSVGLVVVAMTAIVDFDASSSFFFLSTSMTNGCRFLQDQQLLSEVGVRVRNLDLRRLLEAGVPFKDFAVLHVHGFGDAF